LAGLNIPSEHLKALVELLNLSEEETTRFLSSISRLVLSVQFDKLTATIAPKLKVLSVGDAETAAEALVSLYATRAPSEVLIPEFVDDVLGALAQREPQAVLPDKRDRAARQLERLLSCEPLSVAAKAMQLMTDQERLFFDARILTDVRPVYGIDPGAAPVGVVINQTLRITYLQDDKSIDFYVAMDSQDISKLRSLLDRAQIKAEGLRKIFESAKIPVIQS
jgi:hypothetical protein